MEHITLQSTMKDRKSGYVDQNTTDAAKFMSWKWFVNNNNNIDRGLILSNGNDKGSILFCGLLILEACQVNIFTNSLKFNLVIILCTQCGQVSSGFAKLRLILIEAKSFHIVKTVV